MRSADSAARLLGRARFSLAAMASVPPLREPRLASTLCLRSMLALLIFFAA
jgi:hypothetical protein